MKNPRLRSEMLINVLWTFLAFSMVACGGGGGGLLADGGIGGTGVVSSGSVSSLGSIEVNGVHYLVADANYTREGEASIVLFSEAQTAIKVGMVVEVDGELDETGINGQALTVSYEDILESTIDVVATLGGTVKVLTMLNQQVIVEDGFTAMNGVTFSGLNGFNGMLEVSGFRLIDGRIQATYVESRAIGRYEIKGVVTQVNSATSFDIGNLNILHTGAIVVTAKDLVEVKGVNGSAYVNPTLTALSVTIESAGFSVADKDEAEIEGFVSGADPITAGEQFMVNGQVATYNASTLFDGGSVNDLVQGSKIEAEGRLTGGVLAARKITFKEGVRLESDIESINLDNGTLTLNGLVGVTVIVDPATTELNGITSLADLNPNEHIRLRGQLTATSGTVLATRVDLRSPSLDVILRGPVEDDPIVVNQITILGIPVDTTPITTFSIEEDDGFTITPTTSTDFYNRLQPGEIVKLKGSMNGSVLTWSEAEKQNEL